MYQHAFVLLNQSIQFPFLYFKRKYDAPILNDSPYKFHSSFEQFLPFLVVVKSCENTTLALWTVYNQGFCISLYVLHTSIHWTLSYIFKSDVAICIGFEIVYDTYYDQNDSYLCLNYPTVTYISFIFPVRLFLEQLIYS